MPLGRRLVVALSVLATGAATALFFRKDASKVDSAQEASDDPFGHRVERRIIAGAAWARKIGGPLPAVPSGPVQRVTPSSTTAAILEPHGPVPDAQPTFQKSFNPVGALLEPIEGVAGDDRAELATGAEGADEASDSGASDPRTHRIVDGDTLSKLASRYLGRADRFLEIFEFNRDVLASPDLLPIGSTLKIPSRRDKAPASP
jgi:LysM repeat protein